MWRTKPCTRGSVSKSLTKANAIRPGTCTLGKPIPVPRNTPQDWGRNEHLSSGIDWRLLNSWVLSSRPPCLLAAHSSPPPDNQKTAHTKYCWHAPKLEDIYITATSVTSIQACYPGAIRHPKGRRSLTLTLLIERLPFSAFPRFSAGGDGGRSTISQGRRPRCEPQRAGVEGKATTALITI